MARNDSVTPSEGRISPAGSSSRPAFVRERAPRRTQPPVNDTQADEYEHTYTHESSYTLSGLNPVTGRNYRKARSNINRARKEFPRYGQYLSVPKGNRDIFASREQTRRQMWILVGGIVVVVLIVIAIIFALL